MIRAARLSDALAVAALWNWMIRETLATFTNEEKTEGHIEKLIEARRDAFLVSERDGKVQGFAHFGDFRGGPGYAATCEHSIVVAPEAQGSGIGQRLLLALIDIAKAQGKHVMVAGISGVNTKAISFHENLGFVRVGLMPDVGQKGGQWLDLVLMQKILSETDCPPDSRNANG